MNLRSVLDSDVFRVSVLVVFFSFLLTAAMYGVVAVFVHGVELLTERIPYYVVVGALVFVVSMFVLEDPSESGLPIITTTTGLGIAGFLLVGFAWEGIRFGWLNRELLLSSNLVLYFLAAALICTATGYWGLHHWREFAEPEAAEPE